MAARGSFSSSSSKSAGVAVTGRVARLLFLQANNFHFLCAPRAAGAGPREAEPDAPVDWEEVRAVRHVATQPVRAA